MLSALSCFSYYIYSYYIIKWVKVRNLSSTEYIISYSEVIINSALLFGSISLYHIQMQRDQYYFWIQDIVFFIFRSLLHHKQWKKRKVIQPQMSWYIIWKALFINEHNFYHHSVLWSLKSFMAIHKEKRQDHQDQFY